MYKMVIPYIILTDMLSPIKLSIAVQYHPCFIVYMIVTELAPAHTLSLCIG